MADASSDNSLRFRSEHKDVEDRLKAQSTRLLQLSDYRKRRAEVLQDAPLAPGPNCPVDFDANVQAAPKSKRKVAKKGAISFGDDDEEESHAASLSRKVKKSNKSTIDATDDLPSSTTRKLIPNNSAAFVAKSMTKPNLQRESQLRDHIRQEFLTMQSRVKRTEFILPFVFYDGTATSGGNCRMKKGDQIWLFLDRARKAGAEQRVGGAATSVKVWARISVDDLMLVRGDLILPHHYEFYYFLLNKVKDRQGLMFAHSAETTAASPAAIDDEEDAGGLSVPGRDGKLIKPAETASLVPDAQLEGYDDDPTMTKVVDRRWYEKNKHIFPASTWLNFEPDVDYSKLVRKDAQGNVFHA